MCISAFAPSVNAAARPCGTIRGMDDATIVATVRDFQQLWGMPPIFAELRERLHVAPWMLRKALARLVAMGKLTTARSTDAPRAAWCWSAVTNGAIREG